MYVTFLSSSRAVSSVTKYVGDLLHQVFMLGLSIKSARHNMCSAQNESQVTHNVIRTCMSLRFHVFMFYMISLTGTISHTDRYTFHVRIWRVCPITGTAWDREWVFSRLDTVIMGSNPVQVMNVFRRLTLSCVGGGPEMADAPPPSGPGSPSTGRETKFRSIKKRRHSFY
jgi:hypothetical protein